MDGNIENSYSKKNKKPLIIAIGTVAVLLLVAIVFFGLKFFRDARRRADYETLSKNISEIYISSNMGSLPNEDTSIDPSVYINESGNDPSGNGYTIRSMYCASESDCSEEIIQEPGLFRDSDGRANTIAYIVSHASCSDNRPVYSESNTAFVVYGYLETGSYCYANES